MFSLNNIEKQINFISSAIKDWEIDPQLYQMFNYFFFKKEIK